MSNVVAAQFPLTEQVNGVSPLNGDALDGTVKVRGAPPQGSLMMDIAKVHPDPDNIRRSAGDVTEMADSIRQVGVLSPLTVAPHPDRAGHYYVKAVRAARAQKAVAAGHADQRETAGLTWEPDHFTDQHPLARKARALCDARQHNNRRRLGKVACGQCFESVIRDDERIVVMTQMAAETK